MTNINAELVAALERARRYVADIPIVGDADLAMIDAALARAKGTWPAEREVGQAVYERIEKLIDAKPDTPEGVELSYLSHLVESVEEVGGYDGPEQALARAKGGEPDMTPVDGLWKNQKLSRLKRVKAYQLQFGGDIKAALAAVDEEAARQGLAALQEPGHG